MGMRGGAHGRLAPRWKRPPSRRRGLRALCRASAGRRESAASILFTCGGTGGHVYPAVAVADRLRSLVPDLAIDFVGSRDRIEWDVVPKSGYAVRSVPCAPIHRPLSSWRNVRSVLVQFLGLLKALWLLARKRPRAGKNRFRWRCNRVRLAPNAPPTASIAPLLMPAHDISNATSCRHRGLCHSSHLLRSLASKDTRVLTRVQRISRSSDKVSDAVLRQRALP